MATVEATTEKVQRILVDEFNDVRLRKSGGFILEVGSSAAFVEIQEWTPDKDGNPRSLIYIWAPLGRDVKPQAARLLRYRRQCPTPRRRHAFRQSFR